MSPTGCPPDPLAPPAAHPTLDVAVGVGEDEIGALPLAEMVGDMLSVGGNVGCEVADIVDVSVLDRASVAEAVPVGDMDDVGVTLALAVAEGVSVPVIVPLGVTLGVHEGE